MVPSIVIAQYEFQNLLMIDKFLPDDISSSELGNATRATNSPEIATATSFEGEALASKGIQALWRHAAASSHEVIDGVVYPKARIPVPSFISIDLSLLVLVVDGKEVSVYGVVLDHLGRKFRPCAPGSRREPPFPIVQARIARTRAQKRE